MPPVDIDATVIENHRLSRDYSVLSLAAPEVGRRTLPGQFVMVKPAGVTDPLLRRPFSVFEVLRDSAGDVTGVSILNKRAGRSTKKLYELEPGDVVSCLGPLGMPFKPVAAPVEAWMVAGGVGLAPFATLAESLARTKTPTTLFYGARTAEELFYLDFFEELGITLVLTTEDGGRGVRGRVTGPLEAALKTIGSAGAMIYACGPEPMLEAVAKLCARYNQSCQVSVERVMGCGLGGCYSCVVPVKHGNEEANFVRSCISGPVFDGAELVWE
ncbi:MAG TPA: dihydroorotate dehydrogenase electron transfer subunit [Vicinamibacterales bacterium]|nr:dihydroorotate dehydrogenase electron transfer subunit [Vicinamibacterales bacterium]